VTAIVATTLSLEDAPAGADGFRPALRERRQELFAVGVTSTGASLVTLEIGGRARRVYDNANLSVYSAQTCNARCPFCVEELRPLSRGTDLAAQKRIEADDERYFARLERALDALRPIDPSVSITGGEPSKDPRLPRILETIARRGARKRTMTTNASGLLDALPEGGDVLDRVLAARLAHLNISRADPDETENQRVMRIDPPQSNADLARIVGRARDAGVRVRLSCVLLRGRTDSIEACERYLAWAASLGVDNVVFRRLMQYDRATFRENLVTRFTDARGAPLRPILEALRPASLEGATRPGWRFAKQVLGYYYYVEVYRHAPPAGPAIDVVLEEADLAWIERDRRRPEPIPIGRASASRRDQADRQGSRAKACLEDTSSETDAAEPPGTERGAASTYRDRLIDRDDVVHELIFHPDGALCSSWQPWDGVLIPAHG